MVSMQVFLLDNLYLNFCHLTRSTAKKWENDKELDTKVDAAIEDGDSLCHRFCPDSLVDHIAAKVLALEMDEELLILIVN
jgi:hypothetical protein